MRTSSLFALVSLGALATGGSLPAQITLPAGPAASVSPATSAPASSPAPPHMKDISDILAHAGTEDFRIEDIRPYLAKLTDDQKAALAKDPDTLKRFVRTFIIQRLLLSEARAAKWDQQPDVVIQLQRVQENAIADGYLDSVSKVPADYPSDADLRAAYEANKSAFIAPRKTLLAQIFIALPKGASKEVADKAQAKLQVVKETLKDPRADFTKLAAAKSEEPKSASQGGIIGWLDESQIHPSLRKQAIALPKGAVSEPIQLEIGWVILKAMDVKEPAQIPLDDVRGALTQRLRANKARQLSEAYVAKMLDKNPPAVNETALNQLLAPTAK